MPARDLNEFLTQNATKPAYKEFRLVDIRDAACDYVDEFGGYAFAPKSFADGFALGCKDLINKESRAIAQTMARDKVDKKIEGPPRGEVVRKFNTIIAAAKEKARIADMQAAALKISDYYEGKERRISTGGTITITIEKEAWEAIEAGNGSVEQIKGILSNDPIQVLPSGKLKGVRCIKPEPYGWCFSTSISLRLVDDTTDTGTYPPASLTFNTTKQGH